MKKSKKQKTPRLPNNCVDCGEPIAANKKRCDYHEAIWEFKQGDDK